MVRSRGREVLTAEEKLLRVRQSLILNNPFFAQITILLELIKSTECETGWTDGKHMGYNPKWIDTLTIPKAKGFVVHEDVHIMLEHPLRRGDRDLKIWNIACDFVDNAFVLDAGFELPDGGCINNELGKNRTAETVYDMLMKNNKKLLKELFPQYVEDDGNFNINVVPKDLGGCGEIRDWPSKNGKEKQPSQSEITQASGEIKVMIAQAAEAAKRVGNLSANLERFVKEILEPKIPWPSVLWRFVTQSAKNDYAWFPPNRRYLSQGLYLPSLNSEQIDELVIVVDTSGSISDSDIAQFSAECSSILEQFDTTIHVVYCSTKVTHTESFTRQDLPLTLHAKGGGGTDFRPPFRWVENHQINPACLIYLTDMACYHYPEKEPFYPTLWVKIGTWDQDVPPFGEVINIDI